MVVVVVAEGAGAGDEAYNAAMSVSALGVEASFALMSETGAWWKRERCEHMLRFAC